MSGLPRMLGAFEHSPSEPQAGDKNQFQYRIGVELHLSTSQTVRSGRALGRGEAMAKGIVVLALGLALAGPASANPTRTATIGAAAIEARLAPDGIHAVVSLDRDVTRFAFAPRDVVRQGDFDLLTPGLSLAGDQITGAKPFRRFVVRIRPTAEERDAKYPAHYRIGDGGVVYAPALQADPAIWVTRLTFRTGPGQVRLPATGEVGDGFVFIGPAALRTDTPDVTVVADPATPPWLVERVRTDLAAAVRAFSSAMRVPLPRKPLLIVKHQAGPRSFRVGDVTPGAITTLRFHGDDWLRPNAASGKAIQEFVLHEAFHFWNGGLVRHAGDTPTWLHEGGAEYASLMGGLATGLLSDDDVRGRLSQALTRCREAVGRIGDKGLASLGFLSNQVRYPCGMVLQWATDLHVRRASAGKRTVMAVWADTVAAARRRRDKSYHLADFYAAAGLGNGAAFQPAALLVDQSGPDRWRALAPALNALGADVTAVANAESRRPALLMHLLAQNCRDLPEGASRGFYFGDSTIKLDSPAGCGALAGNPVLRTVEGGDPFEMTDETYKAVQRKCAAGRAVTVITVDGRSLDAVCREPLVAAPEAYVVREWRPADGRRLGQVGKDDGRSGNPAVND